MVLIKSLNEESNKALGHFWTLSFAFQFQFLAFAVPDTALLHQFIESFEYSSRVCLHRLSSGPGLSEKVAQGYSYLSTTDPTQLSIHARKFYILALL